jgi:hypothetical protein
MCNSFRHQRFMSTAHFLQCQVIFFFSGYLTFVTSMKVRQTRHPSNLKNMSKIIPKKNCSTLIVILRNLIYRLMVDRYIMDNYNNG